MGTGYAKSLGVFLNGATIPNPNPRGEPVIDDNLYIIFNAHYEPLDFILPIPNGPEQWVKELDTATGWMEVARTLTSKGPDYGGSPFLGGVAAGSAV